MSSSNQAVATEKFIAGGCDPCVYTDMSERADLAGIPGRLRAARERAGLSQEAAARKIGVSLQTISRYERGKRGKPEPE
ncbi:MAG: helix-turn-helix transcriptional regulator, partial [Myxococcota bacterium]